MCAPSGGARRPRRSGPLSGHREGDVRPACISSPHRDRQDIARGLSALGRFAQPRLQALRPTPHARRAPHAPRTSHWAGSSGGAWMRGWAAPCRAQAGGWPTAACRADPACQREHWTGMAPCLEVRCPGVDFDRALACDRQVAAPPALEAPPDEPVPKGGARSVGRRDRQDIARGLSAPGGQGEARACPRRPDPWYRARRGRFLPGGRPWSRLGRPPAPRFRGMARRSAR